MATFKEQDRLRRACRQLADAIGTPAYQAALARWFAAYAAVAKPEKTTLN